MSLVHSASQSRRGRRAPCTQPRVDHSGNAGRVDREADRDWRVPTRWSSVTRHRGRRCGRRPRAVVVSRCRARGAALSRASGGAAGANAKRRCGGSAGAERPACSAPVTPRRGEAVGHGATRGRERRSPGHARQPTDALAKPPCGRIEHEVDESMLLINNASVPLDHAQGRRVARLRRPTSAANLRDIVEVGNDP